MGVLWVLSFLGLCVLPVPSSAAATFLIQRSSAHHIHAHIKMW